VAAVTAVDRLFAAGREPEVIHSHAAVASLIGLLVPTSAERRSGSCRPCTDGDRPRPPSSRQPTSAF
jgi:hypothetical protein